MSTQEASAKVTDTLIEGFKSKPLTTLLVVLALIPALLLAAGGYYVFAYALPNEVNRIQRGYEIMEASHAKQLDSRDKHVELVIQELREHRKETKEFLLETRRIVDVCNQAINEMRESRRIRFGDAPPIPGVKNGD